jgi:hypothetical protein
VSCFRRPLSPDALGNGVTERELPKMTTEVSLIQRSVHAIDSHSDVPRAGHLMSRAAYVVFLLAVLFGSFCHQRREFHLKPPV